MGASRYKSAYRRLNYAFFTLMVFVLLPLVSDDLVSGNMTIVWIVVFCTAGLTYMQALVTLVDGAKLNVGLWVIGTISTGPIGLIVSFMKIRLVVGRNGWDRPLI